MSEAPYIGDSEFNPDSFKHYGVKGMRWGVRRSGEMKRSDGKGSSSSGEMKRSDGKGSSSSGGKGRVQQMKRVRDEKKFVKNVAQKADQVSLAKTGGGASGGDVMVYANSKKGVLGTRGGEGRHVSDDAVVAAALRQIGSTNTISSLSNSQLEIVTKRLNLEINYQNALGKRYPPKAGNPFLAAGKSFIKKELDTFSGGGTPKSYSFVKHIKTAKAAKAAEKTAT